MKYIGLSCMGKNKKSNFYKNIHAVIFFGIFLLSDDI